MMFVALDENNRRITLTSHQQARQLAGGRFHCPLCQQRVFIKNGVVLPAHFAHRQRPIGEGEPESAEHLAGKSWLATWLRQHERPATLEYYDAAIRQRADILIHQQPPKVLEFQASPLSIPDLKKRTTMYHRRGWQVGWILGRRYHDSQGKRQARKFLTLENDRLTLWYLNVQIGTLSRLQLKDKGRLWTHYAHDNPPSQQWQSESVDGYRQARQIALSLQKRARPWMRLQALAYERRHNLQGAPWVVHNQPHPLRHFGVPELRLRIQWLLIFEGRSFTAAQSQRFWVSALPDVWTPLLPARTLARVLDTHWLALIKNAGLIGFDGSRYQWRQLPQWFADIDRKLANITHSSEKDCG